MITTKEFTEFLKDDTRQILALKKANLLKINAIDEETNENIANISYICYVDFAIGATPLSNYEKTKLIGLYDKANQQFYYHRIYSIYEFTQVFDKVAKEVGAISFKDLDRMVKKAIDRRLNSIYQETFIKRAIECRTDSEDEFKKAFMDQRMEGFFETGTTVYGKDNEYITDINAYDYVKLVNDKEYVSELVNDYLSSEGSFYNDKTNLDINIEKYINNQVKLKVERNIELNDEDDIILSLLKNISRVENARTVKVVYEQGHNSIDLDLDVDELKNCNYRSLVSNNYAFPSYAIKTRRGADDFTEMFRSKDNPFGYILVKGIKKVTYGRKTLYEVK
ncbi:hypothetical protein INF23_05735 [Ligilactobacillus salivarius]|uniref:hypothetical protein n=1 Tax=Ligilactobacillus salivarius TaxID=1624 RepID=UPI00187397D0|nr:hypothetical protein [Ligilactobacillus salivarius]MBE5067106.1 hypothetical protein [Ligilactobacillus salivarius]